MKNFFLSRLASFVGGKLNGYKTKIGASCLILLALVGCAGKMFPDSGLPQPEWDTIGAQFSAGLAVFGVGHKIDKNTAITIPGNDCSPEQKQAMTDSSKEPGPAAPGQSSQSKGLSHE